MVGVGSVVEVTSNFSETWHIPKWKILKRPMCLIDADESRLWPYKFRRCEIWSVHDYEGEAIDPISAASRKARDFIAQGRYQVIS